MEVAMKKMFLLGLAVGAGLMLTRPFLQAALAVPQPHMQDALRDLNAAYSDLLVADSHHDHGGYAGAATTAIQQAISDVQQAIAYRDSHGP